MPRVSIGDCHLHYERSGAGFPVILVTGLSGVASFWREQVPVLSRAFDVIAFDHRGVGQSDHSRISYTVERLAADVIGLMDVLGVAKAHVVGHSTGGAIAQIIGIEHPARVASLVIAASWTKADAYFRRLFALRREILLRLGPSSYVAASSLFSTRPISSRRITRRCANARPRRSRPSRRRRSWRAASTPFSPSIAPPN